MMRPFATVLLVLGSVGVAQAQEAAPAERGGQANVAPDFAATSAAKTALMGSLAAANALFPPPLAKPLNTSEAPVAPSALAAPLESADPAAPSPNPKFLYGGRDDYRWQLGLSFAWLRFRSSIFDASAVGVQTSVTYFTNEWLGVEGNVTAAFAPTIYNNEHVKLAIYGGGPKIAWRQRQWEPWAHAIFGGAHEQPQTAGNSRNSYSIQVGGGADYRKLPNLSFRLEGDYVRTGFFKQSQNNFQLSGGFVFHF